MAGQVAELDGEGAHGGTVVAAGGEEETDVGVYELEGVVSAGTEIEEFEFVG